jgi:hypothetical protein
MDFIYGRPVRGSEFLNRESEMSTIFSRINNGESTAVVGEAHIGKSSVLLKIREHLQAESPHLSVSLIDLHPVSGDYSPRTFWQEALEPVSADADPLLQQRLAAITQATDLRRPLERLFDYLASQNRSLIVLLDEFETLLSHPNFKDSSFFALLRSLATRTGGLSLVTATRLSVAEMNARGRTLLQTGSPFFNNMIEVRLHSFDERTIGALLAKAGDNLSSADRRFIRRVAGLHPFLLQALTATLLEAAGSARYSFTAENFFGRVSFHFDDVWSSLDDRTRTTAVILSLVEFGGRALGRGFSYGEIERVDAFGPELRKLADRGLAEQVGSGWQFDAEHLLVWRGERWTIGSQAFAWWVRDLVIGGARDVQKYEDWLAAKRYVVDGLLTQQQFDKLISVVRSAPDWAMRGVGGLARSLFDELLKGVANDNKK